MSKRWLWNFCAVCVVVLYCAALVAITGCASVKMTKVGEDVTWTSKTLWKDIDSVESEAEGKDFKFGLGSSSNPMSDEQAQAMACLLNPAACK